MRISELKPLKKIPETSFFHLSDTQREIEGVPQLAPPTSFRPEETVTPEKRCGKEQLKSGFGGVRRGRGGDFILGFSERSDLVVPLGRFVCSPPRLVKADQPD